MKRSLSILLVLLMLALAGCGNANTTTESSDNTGNGQSTATQEETTAPKNTEAETPGPEESKPSDTGISTGILVLYFSRTGEQYNVGVIDKGNTAIVAEMIADETGADLFEVLPVDDHYPMTYDALTDVAKQEQNDKARPQYQGELPDLSAYNTVFVGAPVWWGDWPMIMYTVFENNDFSGKTLIPFSTHEGSGLSGFDKKLQNACPDAEVLKGLAVRGNDAQNNQDKARESVQGWLKELGF